MTPVIVAPLHRHFSPVHLADVTEEMGRRGTPDLHAYFDSPSGAWFAREGTHRLRAAFILGLSPVLIPIAWWRAGTALERARFAAIEYGYVFPLVHVRTV